VREKGLELRMRVAARNEGETTVLARTRREQRKRERGGRGLQWLGDWPCTGQMRVRNVRDGRMDGNTMRTTCVIDVKENPVGT
jgi:hypothetical protein